MKHMEKGRELVRREIAGIIIGLASWIVLANVAYGCVGRLLVVAVNGAGEQMIMGQMLSVLINERTGTTVDLVEPGDLKACHEALVRGNADIYINYIGSGVAGEELGDSGDDSQKLYTLVSQSYLEKFGMVWLKPFGFKGPEGKEKGSLAAPVTTKEVLRKFPVLDRLINKLGGKIDSKVIAQLEKNAEGRDVKEVVTEFLKSQRLI
jgi:glycine betaine/choline ABC-type transport system substrate-binding protein